LLHSNVREKSKQDRLPNRSRFDKNKGHPEQVRNAQHETRAWTLHGDLREHQHCANPHQSWLDWSLSSVSLSSGFRERQKQKRSTSGALTFLIQYLRTIRCGTLLPALKSWTPARLNECNHMVLPNAGVKYYPMVVMCGSGFIVSVWVSSSASALYEYCSGRPPGKRNMVANPITARANMSAYTQKRLWAKAVWS
jgi:hypothetical protein